MNKLGNRTAASLNAMLMALLLALLLCIVPTDVYAAGQINVDLAKIEGVGEDFPGFTFELYEVGGYKDGYFQLDPEYPDVDVKILPEKEYNETKGEDDPSWQEAWLESAGKLANHIQHPADGESAKLVTTFSGVMPGDRMTYNSDKDALYLLIGSTVEYNNAKYTPVPIYVRTLNGEETYTIDAETKIRIEPLVFEHSLMKTWDDNNNAANKRPKSIEVGIYYGSQLIDRVVLGGDSGEWTYKWKSEETGETYKYIGTEPDGTEFWIEFTPGENDNAWGVREFTVERDIADSGAKAESANLKYYKPVYEKKTSETLELFIINNPMKTTPPPNPKVKTGDETNLGLWAGIAAVAAVLLVVFFIRRRRGDR